MSIFIYLIFFVDFWGSSARVLMKLTIDTTLDSSALFHTHQAAFSGFYCCTLIWFKNTLIPVNIFPFEKLKWVIYVFMLVFKTSTPFFLKFSVQISNLSLIIYIWDYLYTKTKLFWAKGFRIFWCELIFLFWWIFKKDFNILGDLRASLFHFLPVGSRERE